MNYAIYFLVFAAMVMLVVTAWLQSHRIDKLRERIHRQESKLDELSRDIDQLFSEQTAIESRLKVNNE